MATQIYHGRFTGRLLSDLMGQQPSSANITSEEFRAKAEELGWETFYATQFLYARTVKDGLKGPTIKFQSPIDWLARKSEEPGLCYRLNFWPIGGICAGEYNSFFVAAARLSDALVSPVPVRLSGQIMATQILGGQDMWGNLTAEIILCYADEVVVVIAEAEQSYRDRLERQLKQFRQFATQMILL